MNKINVVLIGQPNVGKSTIFNLLTGLNQVIANYSGVTIEKKTGKLIYNNYELIIKDLPGIYSINTYSPEEIITRKEVLSKDVDIIINVVDASNLSNSLYLTLQLMEMHLPIIILLNMLDKSTDTRIDIVKFNEVFNVPVVQRLKQSKEGLNDLLQNIIKYPSVKKYDEILYNIDIENKVNFVIEIIKKLDTNNAKKWIAIKLLEGDKDISSLFNNDIYLKISEEINSLFLNFNTDIIYARNEYIKTKLSSCTKCVEQKKFSYTQLFDKIFLHNIIGIPLFFTIMYVVFQIVFILGEPLVNFLEFLLFKTQNFLSENIMPHVNDSVKSFIIDGIIGGVGSVVVFTPNVMLVFLALSFLEASGYIARVVVITDHYMEKIGLSGKSFIPLILGFGCSIPAIMATRIIEKKWERYLTIMLIPFISCSAKMPVYILLISTFITTKYQGITLLFVYMLGVLVAFFIALILTKFLRKNNINSLLIELPKYNLPDWKNLFIQTWIRTKHFLHKAGSIILISSSLLWFLANYPKDENNLPMQKNSTSQLEKSYIAKIGKVVEPITQLIGGDWRIASSFIASFAAKEVFISQLNILYAIEHDDENISKLQNKIKNNYSFTSSLAFIVFILFSAPCVATLSVIKSETNSWKFAFLSFVSMNILAFIMSFIIYKIALLVNSMAS